MPPSTQSETTHRTTTFISRYAWLPIPLFIFMIASMWVANSQTVHESQLLLLLSNLVFSALASSFVVLLLFRSFLSQNKPELLLFGCGVLFWGAAGTVGPALMSHGGNVTISIHNILVFLSALCQFTGAILSVKSIEKIRSTKLVLAVVLTSTIATVWLVALLVLNGMVPVFFVQAEGGTMLRQIMLFSSILMFVGSVAILWRMNWHGQTVFVHWYGLALLLIATGLAGVMLQSLRGSALNWTARAAQMLGGFYMLVAAVASLRRSNLTEISLSLNEDWLENEFFVKIQQQSLLGLVLRYALSFVFVASAMGIRLMLEAWGGMGLPPYITFYPAVMAVALLAGFGPGVLATLLTGLVVLYWLLPPIGQFAVTSTIDRLGLVIFIGMGLFMSLFSELYRRNRDKFSVFDREAALRESEKRLALAVSATQIGMFDLDIARGTVLWTQTHEAIFGYVPATNTTTTAAAATATAEHDKSWWTDRVHPEDLHLVEVEAQRCMQERKPLEIKYRIIWSDGSLHWVETKGVYQYESNGTASHLIGVVRDITEQKQAEEMLRASEDQLRSLADSIPNLAWWANSDGYITWYNKRWYEYTGMTPEQMEGWGWKSVHAPDELPKVLDSWKASLATGEPFEMIFPLRGADGVYRQFLTRGIPLKDDAGCVKQWFGTNTDVSELEHRVAERTEKLASTINLLQREMFERKLAEIALQKEITDRLQATETLRENERMLIQQSRQAAMGEMISNIAHQWRQPLNTLGLYAQKIGLYYGSPDFNKEFLDTSISKCMEIIKHMSRTIDDFRNYFKPEKEKTDFYVIEAIKSTMSLLDGNFHNPKITIDFLEYCNPVINGYQNEFAQVFLNILNNARDVIIERKIVDAKVTITISGEDNCAVVTVADNAGGIPDEIINKVFDPYFTTKGPKQGTGIGLFMSKTIIEKNMGGRLTVRNTDNGAEFRIEVEQGTHT
jgi:PAS domain S-box-containing protein